MLSDQRKKEIFKEIDMALAQGVRKQELFNKYSSEFADRDPLAVHLLWYISPQDLKKNGGLTKAYAVCLTILSISLMIYYLPSLLVLVLGLWGYKLILLPLLALICFCMPMVALSSLVCFVSGHLPSSIQIGTSLWIILFGLREEIFFSEGHWPAIGMALGFFIFVFTAVSVILAFKLKKIFFPAIKGSLFTGLVKKDKSGNYIFP